MSMHKDELRKGFDLSVDSENGCFSLVKNMGTGIPLVMTLRELGINGIESCLRNMLESENWGVWVHRGSHEHENKLAITNTGGDFLSEKIFRKHLAQLGNTGNIGANGMLDANKGIGPKPAYLPKARDGLVYKSVSAGQNVGHWAQMCEDLSLGKFHVPARWCSAIENYTAFPVTKNFDKRIPKNMTGTTAICMGDYPEFDTWEDFDRICSVNQKKESGTGYGLMRFFTQRFWEEPQVPFRVSIYEANTYNESKTVKINGLKRFMKSQKIHGEVSLNVAGYAVTAHWSVIPGYGEEGYKSNWAASGLTALAWKAETYFNYYRTPYLRTKDVHECGVVVKANRVMIVFELSQECSLATNLDRSTLFRGEDEVPKEEFHEAFRQKMPQKLREWQEENQVKSKDDGDVQKYVNKRLQKMASFMAGGTLENVSSAVRKVGKKTGTPKIKIPKNNPIAKKLSPFKKLKNYESPSPIYIEDPAAPLVEFHKSSYEVVINLKSEIWLAREASILRKFNGPCLCRDYVTFLLKSEHLLNISSRLIEIFFRDMSPQEKEDYWLPKCLESCWSYENTEVLFKKAKEKHDKAKAIAA